jgi:predicted transcriptional regulator
LPGAGARRTMSYMNAITIRVPPKLRKDLAHLCKRQHRSPSEVVRESLRRYIVAEELRQMRQRLRPHAEAAGFFTDEDVFRAVS